MEFQGTDRYYLDPELGAIVNMALVMEKPLLLTGEAGTGKTQLGFEVARARYFTRRFPRPAFAHILADLPGLIASGRLPACRIELIYVPQVPTRETEGSAPNRPLRDRSRVG